MNVPPLGDPPPPMTWNEYRDRVQTDWAALLNSPAGNDERRVHDFLVHHPCMVPGAYSMTGPSGHGPFPSALLSESPLSGVGVRVPDFIWLASDSATFTPVFIEIESPSKRWFTNDEVPTRDLGQAVNQLTQWRAWLDQPENLAVFYATFEIPQSLRRHLTFRPQFVLIYGRRAEFDARPHLRPLRRQFEQHGQVVMTFDRLEPKSDCQQYLTATKGNGRYRALAVPPTFTLGPLRAEDHALIDEIPEALARSPWLTAERRDFLIRRLPYWTTWARNEPRHVIHGEDFLGE